MRRPNRERNHFESSGRAFFSSCPLPQIPGENGAVSDRKTPAAKRFPAPDLNWLFAAYERFSSQLELEHLLITLVEVILETGTASKAWLILQKSGRWAIAARGSLEHESVEIVEDLPLETAGSSPLIPTVKRVLDAQTAAASDGVFSNDVESFNSSVQPRAVLGLPLKFRGEIIGILYLENHFVADAFTPEFQELLGRLSCPMGIALKNAERYQQVNQRVADHRRALAQAIGEFKETQKRLVQCEKMVALGHLIAGIAHEINTPLGAIYASVKNLSNSLDYTRQNLPDLLRKLSPAQQEDFLNLLTASRLKNTPQSFREERQFKRIVEQQLTREGVERAETAAQQLVEMGITEVKHSLSRLLKASNSAEILDGAYHLVLQYRNSENIKLAVDKASTIVAALKRYAHSDGSDSPKTAQIAEEIETVLTLCQHHFKRGIQVSTDYQNLPEIACYPDRLNQVWTNLIHNAIQAMGTEGKLEIIGTRQDNFIRVQIADSGCGIPPEIQNQIFEPFFTTKEAGVGTGLGLDIVRKIVREHRGRIELESQPGRTTFTVWLPIDGGA